MPNYQNSRIYKVKCNKTGLEFIESTSIKLCQRMAQHRNELERFLNGTNPHYSNSYKVLENNDCDIILHEKYACNSKEELNARTRDWIENE